MLVAAAARGERRGTRFSGRRSHRGAAASPAEQARPVSPEGVRRRSPGGPASRWEGVTLSSRSRRLRASAVAACSAALLLAGCDVDPGTGAVPATVPTAAVPMAVPASAPAVPVDRKTAAYRALDCTTRAEWVADGLPAGAWDAETVRSTVADVTGDGVDEVLVQATCPTPTSTPATRVVVLAGTSAAPTVLGVLGDDLFHPQATVTTAGTTVTLSGPSVAGDDPTCCPGHRGTVTYAWDGARFVVAARSEVPGSAPGAPADGEHVGMLRSVGSGEVTVDVVEWFEGAAAVAACREDGVENHGTVWCNEYYVRGAGDEPVTLPVSAGASLSRLDLVTMEHVPVDDVAELAGTSWVSADPDAAGYSRFRTEDGVITALESIYTP